MEPQREFLVSGHMSVLEAINGWLQYRASLVALNALAGSTHANQSKIAALWSEKLGQHCLSELRKSHIDLSVAELAMTRAPVTLQADVALLAQILNWCVDERYIEARPRLPTITVESVDEELPPDTTFIWVLQHVTPSYHGEALEFMLLTGLAPHELERLQDIDYSARRSAIAIGQREGFFIKTPARRRWVPLNERAQQLWRKAVSSLHGETATVFPTVAAMEKAMQRARTRNADAPEGVHQVTPKMMRKWFSSKLAGDVAEHVLQRLLGHRPGSKITRKHYVRSQQADVEEAVESLVIPTME